MPSVPQTPNLDLYVPTPDDYNQSPSWGQLLNQNFEILDSAVPSASNPLTPSAFLVDADLDFHGFSATELATAAFTDQDGAPATLDCIFFEDGEFWVNDGAGNNVQITSGGSVVGATGNIGGLPSTPSGAAINWNQTDGLFDFLGAGATTYAPLRTGGVYLWETDAGATQAVQLSSPASLAASYQLKFPAALPGSTRAISVSSTGQMSVGQLATDEIADSAITKAKVATPSRTTISLASGWSGNLEYWQDAVGMVHVQGSIQKTSGSGTSIATGLPAPVFPSGQSLIVLFVSKGIAGSYAPAASFVTSGGGLSVDIAPTVGDIFNFSTFTYQGS